MVTSIKSTTFATLRNCQAVGRMVWNGQGGAGKTAKCTACSKKIGTRKLYEHLAAQLLDSTPGGTPGDSKKITLELPENPPSTVQEWQRFREQFARIVETTNHMAAEIQELKKQLHCATAKVAEREKGHKHAKQQPPTPPEPPRPQRETVPRPPTGEPEKEGAEMAIDTANPYDQDKDKGDIQFPTPQEAAVIRPSARKSYLEIAKVKKPQLEAFPEVVRERITAGKAAMAAFVRPQPQRQIRPEAVYFKNAQRGSLSKLREALRISLSREAVIHLDFIGGL